MMEFLKVEDLCKVYGTEENRVVALDHVSLSVNKGEFVAIIGSSGSGKSTLLHIIAGVDVPTGGKVYLEGQDVYAPVSYTHLDVYKRQFHDRLEENGHIPLPPYIDRQDEALDREMYQTVYCREEGSVASPTAGLHFTEDRLDKIREKGVKTAYVTLHVGIGTFRPVKCEVVEEHQMHFEEYSVTQENADLINDTRKNGGRIISVGTTSARTLESAATDDGTVLAGHGSTGIFIYPGYRFKAVDALITNFHLPKSTLLMLVSALYDREKMIGIYEEAVRRKYRFFSYGDAMFIE